MIYVISNRNITNKTDHKLFGDGFNSVSFDELRIAKATCNRSNNKDECKEWELELLPENSGQPNDTSYNVFRELRDAKNPETGKEIPCVIFAHGFNQNLEKNLNKAREIEAFGVNVLAFSWPSNPGPPIRKIKEYRKAQKNARRSAFAFERLMDKLSAFVEEGGKAGALKTLVIHSLGNYLLESFVKNPDFENQISFFKNILLHQADVDSEGHEEWVDKISKNCRVIATINESDDTLDYSDWINPDRLGNTVDNLNSKYANYYDFSEAKGANDKHRLWTIKENKNKNIPVFFENVFKGKKPGRKGIVYNPGHNCYELE